MISIYCKQRRKLDRLQKVAEKDIQKFNFKKNRDVQKKKSSQQDMQINIHLQYFYHHINHNKKKTATI